jgi:hypothetical protein
LFYRDECARLKSFPDAVYVVDLWLAVQEFEILLLHGNGGEDMYNLVIVADEFVALILKALLC